MSKRWEVLTISGSLNDFVNQVVTNNLLDNEMPIITSLSSVAIDENIGSSKLFIQLTLLITIISSYEITGGADASSLVSTQFLEKSDLLDPNYENKTSYLFTVRASDPKQLK